MKILNNPFCLIKKKFPFLTEKQCHFMGENIGNAFNMRGDKPMNTLYTNLFLYTEEIIDLHIDSKIFIEILNTNLRINNIQQNIFVAFVADLDHLKFNVIYLEKDKKHKIEKIGKQIFISSS